MKAVHRFIAVKTAEVTRGLFADPDRMSIEITAPLRQPTAEMYLSAKDVIALLDSKTIAAHGARDFLQLTFAVDTNTLLVVTAIPPVPERAGFNTITHVAFGDFDLALVLQQLCIDEFNQRAKETDDETA